MLHLRHNVSLWQETPREAGEPTSPEGPGKITNPVDCEVRVQIGAREVSSKLQILEMLPFGEDGSEWGGN